MANIDFNKWLERQQCKGRYKTKLRLEGYVKSIVEKKICYINGDYYLEMEDGNEIYNCIDANFTGVIAKRRDILNTIQEVYYAKEPEKWQKKNGLYLDGNNENQSVDTFNGTVIYVFSMFLLTIFNERIIGWIVATIAYFIWKSSKYN